MNTSVRNFWPVHAALLGFVYEAPSDDEVQRDQAMLKLALVEALRRAQPWYMSADAMSRAEADLIRSQFTSAWRLLYGESSPVPTLVSP